MGSILTRESAVDPRRRSVHQVLQAWLRLYASMRELGRGLRRRHGASDTALLLLRVIAELEPLAIGELAELTGYHVASLGQMLERMEQAGWVLRQRDEQDRRKVLLRTTERGRELLRDAPLFGPWRFGALAERLSESQLEGLSQAFGWLSGLLSPPSTKEVPMHGCGTRRGFGRRLHFEFGPGGFEWEANLGERLGELFAGFGFARRFRSRRERLERLEKYLTELKAEVEAVEEEIRDLRSRSDEPSGTA
jgi:DNA-binding MarR family transcriptional regulator